MRAPAWLAMMDDAHWLTWTPSPQVSAFPFHLLEHTTQQNNECRTEP